MTPKAAATNIFTLALAASATAGKEGGVVMWLFAFERCDGSGKKAYGVDVVYMLYGILTLALHDAIGNVLTLQRRGNHASTRIDTIPITPLDQKRQRPRLTTFIALNFFEYTFQRDPQALGQGRKEGSKVKNFEKRPSA